MQLFVINVLSLVVCADYVASNANGASSHRLRMKMRMAVGRLGGKEEL